MSHARSAFADWLPLVQLGAMILVGILGFFIVAYMNTNEKAISDTKLKMTELDREIQNIKLAQQTEKGRVDSLQVAQGTVLSQLQEINAFVRSIDGRLIRMEVSNERKR